MPSLPDILMEDFDLGIKGQADIPMYEVLHAIIGDVLDSVRLAMSEEEIPRATQDRVVLTVEDYVANHYGSEDA